MPHEIRDRPRALSWGDEATRDGAGRHDLYLPDASADPADGPGLMPDLRHGFGAGDRERRIRAQSRTRRHDAALLGRHGVELARGRAGDGRTCHHSPHVAWPVAVELAATSFHHTGRALGRLAIFRPRLAIPG